MLSQVGSAATRCHDTSSTMIAFPIFTTPGYRPYLKAYSFLYFRDRLYLGPSYVSDFTLCWRAGISGVSTGAVLAAMIATLASA